MLSVRVMVVVQAEGQKDCQRAKLTPCCSKVPVLERPVLPLLPAISPRLPFKLSHWTHHSEMAVDSNGVADRAVGEQAKYVEKN